MATDPSQYRTVEIQASVSSPASIGKTVRLDREVEGAGSLVGEFVETVCGVPARVVRSRCCGRPAEEPGWTSRLSSLPTTYRDRQRQWPNEPGMRNVSYEGGDFQAAVDAVAADGYGLIGGVGGIDESRTGCGWPPCVGPKGPSCPCSSPFRT